MKHTMMVIAPDKLTVDPRVQRLLDRGRARRMAEVFDPSALGVITVSRRGGELAIVDGQHRAEAARMAGRGAIPVDCKVYDGLTVQQEAELFVKLHVAKAPSIADRLRIRLAAEEQVAVAIHDTLGKYGWRFGRSNSEGCTASIAAIETLQRHGLLDRTFAILSSAYGTARDAGLAPVVSGVGELLAAYGPELTDDTIVKILQRQDPQRWIGLARAMVAGARIPLALAVAQALVNEYNARRRTGRLGRLFG